MYSKFYKIIVVVVAITMSGCITLPGHRQTIEEDNLFIHISAPSKAVKNTIRFNTENTQLVYLPASTQIEMRIKDAAGEHHVLIENVSGKIDYRYRLNGEKINFGITQQHWFTLQVPKLIEVCKTPS